MLTVALEDANALREPILLRHPLGLAARRHEELGDALVDEALQSEGLHLGNVRHALVDRADGRRQRV